MIHHYTHLDLSSPEHAALIAQDIAPIFAGQSAPSRVPVQGFITAGYDISGRLACLQTFHQINHAGPVWIRPDLRGRGIWIPLQRETESHLPSGTVYHQFGTPDNYTQLARMKLHTDGWTVWYKHLTDSTRL